MKLKKFTVMAPVLTLGVTGNAFFPETVGAEEATGKIIVEPISQS